MRSSKVCFPDPEAPLLLRPLAETNNKSLEAKNGFVSVSQPITLIGLNIISFRELIFVFKWILVKNPYMYVFPKANF